MGYTNVRPITSCQKALTLFSSMRGDWGWRGRDFSHIIIAIYSFDHRKRVSLTFLFSVSDRENIMIKAVQVFLALPTIIF